MTVHPGYSGQEFMPEMISKVAEIRRRLDEIHSPAWLEVDGGISHANISMVGKQVQTRSWRQVPFSTIRMASQQASGRCEKNW